MITAMLSSHPSQFIYNYLSVTLSSKLTKLFFVLLIVRLNNSSKKRKLTDLSSRNGPELQSRVFTASSALVYG